MCFAFVGFVVYVNHVVVNIVVGVITGTFVACCVRVDVSAVVVVDDDVCGAYCDCVILSILSVSTLITLLMRYMWCCWLLWFRDDCCHCC